MKLLLDGWSVFVLYNGGILIFFLALFGLGQWGVDYFFKDKQLDSPLRTLTAFSLGSFLLTWACLILMLLGRIWPPIVTAGGFLLPAFSTAYLLWGLYRNRKASFDQTHLWLALGLGLLFLLLLARLAFLKDLVLPPYDDSPDHYLIVMNILHPDSSGQTLFSNIADKYYHIGFHSISAWLTSVSGIETAPAMSLLGQVFLSLAAMSIFYLTLVLTENPSASLFAAICAAVAWKMPAFAANWGKYPAITGLALLPAGLGLLIVWRHSFEKKLIAFPLLIILGLSFLHTRLIICLVIVGVASYLASRLKVDGASPSLRVIVGTCLTIFVSFLFIEPINVFYSGNFYFAFWFITLLLPFAYLKHPLPMLGISLSMLGIWAASSVPVFFDLYSTNWLDPPFVQILLFIPFSLIAGLGYSGLLAVLNDYSVLKSFSLVVPALILISGFTSLNVFYPDVCCNYVSQGDLAAMNWIKENSGPDSVVWVAGFKPRNYMIGTDAGVWVFALTGRNTNKLRYDFDWGSASAPNKICQSGYREVYVYQAGMQYSFEGAALSTMTWLDPVYKNADTQLFKVLCPTTR